MKLKDLRRYLGKGKLRFEEHQGHRHLHYVPVLAGACVSLPSILALSQGGGDAAPANLKGVAHSLGLTLRELEHSQACRISRACVLLLLSSEMLAFCIRRQQQISDDSIREAGVRAMAVSVRRVAIHAKTSREDPWREEELQALDRIRSQITVAQQNPLLNEAAVELLEAMR